MTPAPPVGLLAHGGGVPEAAALGVPVLVLVAFAVLERRARRREAEEQGTDAGRGTAGEG